MEDVQTKRPDAFGRDIPHQNLKIVVYGILSIGFVVGATLFFHYQLETRSERNTLKLATMRAPMDIEELRHYDGSEIIGFSDEFRALKIKHDDAILYLYLDYKLYNSAKDMTNLDLTSLAKLEKSTK